MGKQLTRLALIGLTYLFLGVVIALPIGFVVVSAFAKGFQPFWAALSEPHAISAFYLTSLAVVISLIVNTIFGLAVAWSLCKYPGRLKRILLPLIEIPLAISPVVSGMLFVMMLGSRSWAGGILAQWGISIIFTPVAIVIVTAFVTMPFMAREMVLLMQSQGIEEEVAATLLGASGLKMFLKISIPNLMPALLTGGILTIARGVGEFGAVSVVSGHIRGLTETAPLHIESMYNDYLFTEAYSIATVLLGVAIVSLIIRAWVHRRFPTISSGRIG